MEEVKLLGRWTSPFSTRVICALELKGIKYEYIEQDLTNKSSLLLQYNPVHKKIPVLVHNQQPICESMIILEYLDELWPHVNPLLPTDSYERAIVRFWAKFTDDKGLAFWNMFRSTGEEQQKAKEDGLQMLKAIEEEGLGKKNILTVGPLGLADLVIGVLLYWLQVIEVATEITIFEAKTFPGLYSWFNSSFKEDPVLKKNLPNQYQMIDFFKGLRKTLMAATQ